MSDNAIETLNITKKYKAKNALDDVSVNIPAGCVYGLVGENGAGKSTLIKTICGLVIPDSGIIKYWGQEKVPKGSISAIAERPALYLNMSAYDNYGIQCALLQIPCSRTEINSLLDLCGLEELINSNKKVAEYSLGMRQRLGLAISLMGNPKMIFLDEPTNGLDPLGVKMLRELILMLNTEKGITFCISSHNLSELEKTADVFGFLSHGKLVSEMTCDDLKKKVRPSVKIHLDQVSGVYELMKQCNIDYEVSNEKNTLTIYGENVIDEVIRLLAMRYHILNIESDSNNLETFFLSSVEDKKKKGKD